MKQILIIVLSLLVGLGLGLAVNYFFSLSLKTLSLEEIHQKIITQRDFAIKRATAEGVYNCCVEPACTMCFMEANMWNHQKAGRCDCVDFIVQGEDPCPQCKRILAQ
jgi:hypothetical protein